MDDTRDQAANFRALREQVGYSQQDVADALGVHIRSVKRWEDPRYPFDIPGDAWSLLEAAHEMQRRVVDEAVERACGAGEATGMHSGVPVVLAYWRTQADYDERHPLDPGPFGQANATARAAAERLRGIGFDVSFSFGQTVTPEAWDDPE